MTADERSPDDLKGTEADLREFLEQLEGHDPKAELVDLDAALLPEGGAIEFYIPTGLGGRLKVVAEDPDDATLLARYMKAANDDTKKARSILWDACVVEPARLSEKQDRLTTAFKTTLDEKLMRLAGFDFFIDNLKAQRAEILRELNLLSTESPTPTESAPTKSEAGPQQTSSSPPSSPTPKLNLSAPSASRT